MRKNDDKLFWFLSEVCNTQKKVKYELPSCNKVLVLAPHPDDEVIGCGGLLLQLISKEIPIKVIYMTKGNRRGHYNDANDIRIDESQAAIKLMKISDVVYLNYYDGDIKIKDINKRDLINLIANFSPDLLLAPSFFDPHPDHRVANLILSECLDDNANRTVFLYEVWSPLPSPNRYIDISQKMKLKMEAMSCYWSQEEKYKIKEKSYLLNSFRGSLLFRRKIKAAESFLELEVHKYKFLCSILKQYGWFDHPVKIN